MKDKIKLASLNILAFLLSIGPLLVFVIFERHRFFSSTKGVGVGAFFIFLILIFALKDRLGSILANGGQFKMSLFLLVVFWLLSEISDDLIKLSFFSFVGSLIALIPSAFAKLVKRQMRMKEQSHFTKEALKQENIELRKK